MAKVKFVSRIGGADLNVNPYYNDNKWCLGRGVKAMGTNYQCVAWAFQRTQEIAECHCVYDDNYGVSKNDCENPMFPYKRIPNGKEFYHDTLWSKSVDNPREGDIVCYGSSWGGSYGHVRIIEKIDGNYMYLSGGNENFQGGAKFNIKAPITIGGGASATGLQGYIHNPFLVGFDNEKEIDYKELYEKTKVELDTLKEVYGAIKENIIRQLERL